MWTGNEDIFNREIVYRSVQVQLDVTFQNDLSSRSERNVLFLSFDLDSKKMTLLKNVCCCIGLLVYCAYYFFNLFVLIQTAEKTIINDEMANLSWAYFTKGNVTIQNDISNSQTTVPGSQVLGQFIRGQILTLNDAFEKGMRYDSTKFQHSILSGFPLCKDRFDNDQLLYYNDIAFSICNDSANIKSFSQLLRIGNSHYSLDRLILTEKLLANTSIICDTFHNTSYMYPASKQAIQSKQYLQTLCLEVKNVLIIKGDDLEIKRSKVSRLRSIYGRIFDETTLSTHLVSSNILHSFNVSMAASTNYNILAKDTTKHVSHHGLFSYSFGKWKDFEITFCFHAQNCIGNQKKWLRNAAEHGYIKNYLLVDRILNYSSYEKTPIDLFVDLPTTYLPGHDKDLNDLTSLAKRISLNITAILPPDMNVQVKFTCPGHFASDLFTHANVACNRLSPSPTSSYSGLSSCGNVCTSIGWTIGLTWALRVLKCVGNETLIDLMSTPTPNLIPALKKLSALESAKCKDILKTISQFQYGAYESQIYVRDSDPLQVNATTTQSDYTNLVQYMNPVDDLIMLSNGKFTRKEIQMRFGNYPLLYSSDSVMSHQTVVTQCVIRIAYKIDGLLSPGRHLRISVGLSKLRKLYYGFHNVAVLSNVNSIKNVKLHVLVPNNISFYVKVLLLLNSFTALFYMLLLVVNFLVFKKNFPIPENILVIGRLSMYFPGGKIITMGTSVFSLIAIRQTLANRSIMDILSSSSQFYEFLVLHLTVAWILYTVDDFTGGFLQHENRHAIKMIFWVSLCAWSICTLPLKGKEKLLFLADIEGNFLTGKFLVITFTRGEILFDVVSVIAFWAAIKFIYRSQQTDAFLYDPNFETVYSASLCSILYGTKSIEFTNKENGNNVERNKLVKFDYYTQSSTLTTLWIKLDVGFDFRIWKWVRWNHSKTHIFVEDYLPNRSKTSHNLSLIPQEREMKNVKPEGPLVVQCQRSRKVSALSVGLISFLIYYVAMQIKLLNLVDEVFKNDELSELSIKDMMSSELNFVQSNKSTINNITNLREGYMIKQLILDNAIMALEEAMLTNLNYEKYSPYFYMPTISPCSVRLLHKSLRNESYRINFWNEVLCSHGNDLVHRKFTKQGNFLSATDSLILTQRLLFNSSHFCMKVFAKHVSSRQKYYVNPYSMEANRSIAYLSAICADMTNVSFDNDAILAKYRPIIKKITVSKYFPNKAYIAFFSWGYRVSKYYNHFGVTGKQLSSEISLYAPGPGNWGCCKFHMSFQTENNSIVGGEQYEFAMISWGFGKKEYIERAKNYSNFERSPLSVSFELPAANMPNLVQESLVLFKKLQKIELTDTIYYSKVLDDTIESKIASNISYNVAGFTKEHCPLFSVPTIDYQLTAFSGCSSKKSQISMSKDVGTASALRVLKCLNDDSLIDLLDVTPEMAELFRQFRLPTDLSCNLLLKEAQSLDWSVSPFMYVRSRNKTEHRDMVMVEYFNPIDELRRIRSKALTIEDLMKRVGGLALINKMDSLSVLLYVSIERIRDKANSILNPGMMHLYQPGVYKNGSIFYGTIPNVKIQNYNIFPNHPALEISKSYSSFVKIFVSVGIGISLFYIGILVWSMYSRSIGVPETVMELGRIVILFPGGNLVAFSNGLYSIVGIRQFLSNQNISEMSFGDLMSLAAMHIGSSWFLYITDDLVGEIARLPNVSFVRFVPWLYLLFHAIVTLLLKPKRRIFLYEKNDGSIWNYTFDIQSFTTIDVLIDIGTLVIGWLLLKLFIRRYFRLSKLKFSQIFQQSYSTIICDVMYHTVLDRTMFIRTEAEEILFNNDLTVGLSTVWFTDRLGFNFSNFNWVELKNGKFDSLVVKNSGSKIGKKKNKVQAEDK